MLFEVSECHVLRSLVNDLNIAEPVRILFLLLGPESVHDEGISQNPIPVVVINWLFVNSEIRNLQTVKQHSLCVQFRYALRRRGFAVTKGDVVVQVPEVQLVSFAHIESKIRHGNEA